MTIDGEDDCVIVDETFARFYSCGIIEEINVPHCLHINDGHSYKTLRFRLLSFFSLRVYKYMLRRSLFGV